MRSPQFDPFVEYASNRLNIMAFVPDFDKPDEQLFAASLTSTQALLKQLGPYRNADGAALSVSAGFVEAMTPNAFADWHDGEHVIGMHTALLVTIADFALYAFTQRAFLPTIGDPATETSPLPAFGEAPGLFLLDRTIAGGAIDAATDQHRVPHDAARHEAAIYLAVLMARFVWLHEWAHCARGHVDWLRARGWSARLHEVPDPQALVSFQSGSTRDNLTMRHAMERDADRGALALSLEFQQAGLEPIPGLLAFDHATRIDMTVVAALVMAWLFEEYQRHMHTRGAPSHPAPRDRLFQMTRMASAAASGSDALQSFMALRAHIPAMPDIARPLPAPAPEPAEWDAALAHHRYQAVTVTSSR